MRLDRLFLYSLHTMFFVCFFGWCYFCFLKCNAIIFRISRFLTVQSSTLFFHLYTISKFPLILIPRVCRSLWPECLYLNTEICVSTTVSFVAIISERLRDFREKMSASAGFVLLSPIQFMVWIRSWFLRLLGWHWLTFLSNAVPAYNSDPSHVLSCLSWQGIFRAAFSNDLPYNVLPDHLSAFLQRV